MSDQKAAYYKSQGEKIADAIVKYVDSQDVRYADRAKAVHCAYHELVWAIDRALSKNPEGT